MNVYDYIVPVLLVSTSFTHIQHTHLHKTRIYFLTRRNIFLRTNGPDGVEKAEKRTKTLFLSIHIPSFILKQMRRYNHQPPHTDIARRARPTHKNITCKWLNLSLYCIWTFLTSPIQPYSVCECDDIALQTICN